MKKQLITNQSARSYNRDKLYLDMACIWANNSKALRAKVGALIVSNGRIVSDGYNGQPSGFDNVCEYINENGQLCTKPEVLHAESNAIAKLAKHGGVGSDDASLFCTYSPCIDCAKLIIQAGIKFVHFKTLYRITNSIELLHKAGVKCYIHINSMKDLYSVIETQVDNLTIVHHIDWLSAELINHDNYSAAKAKCKGQLITIIDENSNFDFEPNQAKYSIFDQYGILERIQI